MFSGIFIVTRFEQVDRSTRALTAFTGNLDEKFDIEIALRLPLRIRNAFPFEAQLLAALTAGWDLQFYFATQRRHRDRGARQGLSHRNRYVEKKIFPFTFKLGVRT